MTLKLSILSLLFCFVLLSILIYVLIKGKITIKYSMIWFLSILFIIIFTIAPNVFTSIKNILGIQVSSNLLFAILISLLMIITLVLTIIISKQNTKITLLIQEISLLKNGEYNEK